MTTTPSNTADASSPPTHWLAPNVDPTKVQCLCLGTGRFLRSVLVPIVESLNPVLIQPRGRSFVEYMHTMQDPSYPIDTVLANGEIETKQVSCFGAFSMKTTEDQQALWDFLPTLKNGIQVLGVGVTEAGLASPNTPAMQHLHQLLKRIHQHQQDGTWNPPSNRKIGIVNMDNVPENGTKLKSHMQTLLQQDNDSTILSRLVFFNSMVDRITSQRPNSNGMVPRCEPIPAKALVLCDPQHDFPTAIQPHSLGLVVRSSKEELQLDIDLKLRIANGTHTALAHAMALQSYTTTDQVFADATARTLVLDYLDALVEDQIALAIAPKTAVQEVYQDWRQRLIHPHFGLSTFFITQNGPAKGGLRLGPTVRDLSKASSHSTVSMAFAFAALLRWLTPTNASSCVDGIYTGWLHTAKRVVPSEKDSSKAVEYADGLQYNLDAGWYEFRCACTVDRNEKPVNLSLALANADETVEPIVEAYLLAKEGGNLDKTEGLEGLVGSISVLYQRMVAGDSLLDLLGEMKECKGAFVKGFATDCAAFVNVAEPPAKKQKT